MEKAPPSLVAPCSMGICRCTENPVPTSLISPAQPNAMQRRGRAGAAMGSAPRVTPPPPVRTQHAVHRIHS